MIRREIKNERKRNREWKERRTSRDVDREDGVARVGLELLLLDDTDNGAFIAVVSQELLLSLLL